MPTSEEAHKFLYDEGEKLRRKVLGDAHVERSMTKDITDFARAGQELATEIGWGTIWARPGLEFKQRSLVSISILCARSQQTELAAHIKGGLNNGLTEEELKEVCLQVMVYCGAPAGMVAFRVADAAIQEWKKEHA